MLPLQCTDFQFVFKSCLSTLRCDGVSLSDRGSLSGKCYCDQSAAYLNLTSGDPCSTRKQTCLRVGFKPTARRCSISGLAPMRFLDLLLEGSPITRSLPIDQFEPLVKRGWGGRTRSSVAFPWLLHQSRRNHRAGWPGPDRAHDRSGPRPLACQP